MLLIIRWVLPITVIISLGISTTEQRPPLPVFTYLRITSCCTSLSRGFRSTYFFGIHNNTRIKKERHKFRKYLLFKVFFISELLNTVYTTNFLKYSRTYKKIWCNDDYYLLINENRVMKSKNSFTVFDEFMKINQ